MSCVHAQQSPFDSIRYIGNLEVLYDFGKWDLHESYQTEISDFVDSLANKNDLLFYIEAHTDSIGSIGNNTALSYKRAGSVKEFLLSLSIDSSQIRSKHYGEAIPKVSNAEETGRQLNRRASLFVHRKVAMKTVSGIISNDSMRLAGAKVIFHHKSHKDSTVTDKEGAFTKTIENNKVIGMDVYADDHFFESKMFNSGSYKEGSLDTQLKTLQKDEKIAIDNLYFYGNEAFLLPASQKTLPKVLKFFQQNRDRKFEIGGHINAPFKSLKQLSEFEVTLAQRRAKMLYEYLVENGIDSESISHKGYGNSQMIYPKTKKESEMRWNRRVEIKVIE